MNNTAFCKFFGPWDMQAAGRLAETGLPCAVSPVARGTAGNDAEELVLRDDFQSAPRNLSEIHSSSDFVDVLVAGEPEKAFLLQQLGPQCGLEATQRRIPAKNR